MAQPTSFVTARACLNRFSALLTSSANSVCYMHTKRNFTCFDSSGHHGTTSELGSRQRLPQPLLRFANDFVSILLR